MHQFRYIVVVVCLLLVYGCSAPQKTIYFADNSAQNPTVQVDNIDRRKEIIILPEDIISIKVSTITSFLEKTSSANPASIFNEAGTAYNITSSLGGGSGALNLGFLVDANGFIDYPVLGKLKISGLTLRQVKDMLASKLKDYVKEPVVEASIINYKITVMGEVGHAGSIISPNHKISVIDAIAAAGDIPITGRKDNVLIIRETEGKREFARLNLNSRSVFNSPYYYLKQNDVVYVEPARLRRQQSNEFMQFYLPAITTFVSTILAIYGIVQITKK
jgi:polysaccharide export outer membrane protein